MCGIVGFVSSSRQDEILQKQLQILRHRGPDGTGMLIEQHSGNPPSLP